MKCECVVGANGWESLLDVHRAAVLLIFPTLRSTLHFRDSLEPLLVAPSPASSFSLHIMKANTVAFSRRSCGTTIASDVFSTYPTRVMIREEESGIDPDTHPAKDIFMPKSHLTASILSHGNSYMNTDPDLNFSFSASDGSCGTISGVSTGKVRATRYTLVD